MAYGTNYVTRPQIPTDKFGAVTTNGGPFGTPTPTAIDANGLWDVTSDVTLTPSAYNTNDGVNDNRSIWYDLSVFIADNLTNDFLLGQNVTGQHLTFNNSKFYVRNTGTAGNSISFFHPWQGTQGISNNGSGTSLANDNSINLNNCLITLQNTGVRTGFVLPSFGVDNVTNSTLIFDNRITNSSAGDVGGSYYVRPGARFNNVVLECTQVYVDFDTLNTTTLTSRTAQFTLRAGGPASLEGLTFNNVYPRNQSVNTNLLFTNPQFIAPLQQTYWGMNPANSADNNKGVMVIGPFVWSPVTANMTATNAFASRFSWGGSNEGNGLHFVQSLGYNPTFYTDPEQTTAAEGVVVYARTNMPADITASTTYATIGSRYARDSDGNLPVVAESAYRVSRFISDHEGKLLSNQYSVNNGSTWTNGYINWPRLAVDGTVGAVNTTTNFVSQSAGDNVVAIPIQGAIKNSTVNNDQAPVPMTGSAGMFAEIDVRSLVYTATKDVTRHADTAATGVDRVVTGSIPIDTRGISIERDLFIASRYFSPTITTAAIDADGTPGSGIALAAVIIDDTLFPSGFDINSLPQIGVITMTAGSTTVSTCYTSRTAVSVIGTSTQFTFSPNITEEQRLFLTTNDFTATIGAGLSSDSGIANIITNATNVSMNDLYAIHKYFWSDYQNTHPPAFLDNGTTAALKTLTNSILINIVLSSTGTYSISGTTITVKGANLVTPASEELRSIHINNLNLNGGYIQGGRLAAGTISNPFLATTNEPTFRGVEFTEATTVAVDVSVNSLLVIDDATTITGDNLTINRTGGTAGTLRVRARASLQSNITLGTGVEFDVPTIIVTVDISNVPIGGYYIIHGGPLDTSTIAHQGTRVANQTSFEYRSIAPGTGDTFTQIVGLGTTVTSLRVIHSSALRAARAQLFTVASTPDVTQNFTVSEATNQAAGIATGNTTTGKVISIRNSVVQSGEGPNLFNNETAQSQAVVEVDGFSILDQSTPEQINQLCAASRNTSNYTRVINASIGTITGSAAVERDLWQFINGNQTIVLNGDAVVHQETDAAHGLQILPGYTVSTSATTFTPYSLANQHLSTQIGTYAVGTGTTRAPQVIGQRPYGTRGVETQVTGLSTQITGVGTQVTGVGTQVTGVGTQVTAVGTQVTGVSTQLTTAVTTVNNNTDSQFQEQDDKLRPAFDETVLGIPGSGTRNFPSGGN